MKKAVDFPLTLTSSTRAVQSEEVGSAEPGERSGSAAPAQPRVEEAGQAVVGRDSGRDGLLESEVHCSNEPRSGDSCFDEGEPGGLETKRLTLHLEQLQRAEHLRGRSPANDRTKGICPLCKGHLAFVEYYSPMFFSVVDLPDHDGSPSSDERPLVETASCSVAFRRVRNFFKRVRGIVGKFFCFC